jgi:hypothetical protein
MGKVEISSMDKEAKLLVDTRFYDYNAVLLAAKAFTSSCWVYLDGDASDRLLLCLKPKSSDISLQEVGYEFYNYVLGIMKNAAA